MKILCVGDIVGQAGRQAVKELLPKIKDEHGIEFTVINGENSAGGAGISPRIANELLEYGCDVITLGDHTWDKREIYPFLQEKINIIRPLNFPLGAPGRGSVIVETPSKVKLAVINLLGRVFMRYNVNCPFQELKKVVSEIRKITRNIIVDIHAETTSEKVALGHFIDGEVSAVFGTHTHIQTADEKILPKGTAYITDLGMTGPYDSVIGQNKEQIIQRFLTSMPVKFQVATDDIKLCGIVVEIDPDTGLAKKIERVQRIYQSHVSAEEFSSQE